MALPDVYPIEWYMCFFSQVHTQIHGKHSRFWCFGRAQDLKRTARDQNRIDLLTIIQLAATFQHLALFSIAEFVSVHTNYFDRVMANQKWASQVRFDVIVVMILWVHDKGSCKIYVQQPWKRTACFISFCIIIAIFRLCFFRNNLVNVCMVYGCGVLLSHLG